MPARPRGTLGHPPLRHRPTSVPVNSRRHDAREVLAYETGGGIFGPPIRGWHKRVDVTLATVATESRRPNAVEIAYGKGRLSEAVSGGRRVIRAGYGESSGAVQRREAASVLRIADTDPVRIA